MTDSPDLSNDERESPRVQLPFEVELNHPSLGKIRTVARDISESGIFVRLSPTGLRAGAKVKVTVLNAALVESNPTPTVDMEVARVTEEGLGLKFTNRTSHHLWQSVDRLRRELQLGRDYFQVFQGAAIVNHQNKLLVVQRHGKWLFPGEYLTVGSAWEPELTEYLQRELGLDDLQFEDTLGIDSAPTMLAGENATFSVFHRYSSQSERVHLDDDARYRHAKWVSRAFSLEELTFSHPLLREIAALALERADSHRLGAAARQSKRG
ncbi:MAG TPA: PilZ domain-containing protein [Pseudomonadales bacterium]|nr:PilZ domain-containing protein [Pseudomonadales bacterium]